MRKSSLTALALLASTTLAACGGADKNAYVDSVTKVQQNTQQEASKLSAEMSSAKTPEQVGENLSKLGQAVERNADDLAKIEAPDEVSKQHEEYVVLMRKFGTDLEALAVKVEKATPTTVPTILQKASKLTADLSSGETRIVSEINKELQS